MTVGGRLAVPLFAAAVLVACPSPQSLCKSGVDQVCERVFECQSDQVKQTPQFQATFSTNVEDCKVKLYANPLLPAGQTGIACDDVDDDQKLCANLGSSTATSFDLGKARSCRDARAELSCADYLAQLSDPGRAPADCGQRCQ